MRGLLLLVAVAGISAQENQGFVNPKLITQNFVRNSLRPKPVLTPVVPRPAGCAMPLLEAKVNPNVDKAMAVTPAPKVDEKMILPTVPVCGK